jgi:hypothetical protein
MHPANRSERRHVREVKRDGRRRIMKSWRHTLDLEDNIMWKSGKQSFAHGNRCSCNAEKVLKAGHMRQLAKQELKETIMTDL